MITRPPAIIAANRDCEPDSCRSERKDILQRTASPSAGAALATARSRPGSGARSRRPANHRPPAADRRGRHQSSPHLPLPSFPSPPERFRVGFGCEVEPGIVHRSLAIPPLAMVVHILRSGRDVLPAHQSTCPSIAHAAAGKRHVDAVRELHFSCPLAGHVVGGGAINWGAVRSAEWTRPMSPIRRSNSLCSGPWPPRWRNSAISIQLVWPPDGALGSCIMNTCSASGSRTRYHRSPFGLL
jgi:hypothetical protein